MKSARLKVPSGRAELSHTGTCGVILRSHQPFEQSDRAVSRRALQDFTADQRQHTTTTIFLGETLVFTGKSVDAIPPFEHAIELSPRDPGLGTWQFEMGRAMILLRRDDEALVWLSRSVVTNPRLAYAQLYYAALLAVKGDLPAARGTCSSGSLEYELHQPR